ncbi:hypothetical protein DRE_07324 [Drechslerella stenobrocha 248]|uniref:Uncharacterized protein n=1 Tax=Drechslerella stenobrocha 248 TaxID=1043628 RepID=W7I4Z2_9PEZI|nr:hypothetical protein DRE_07324 [Drechslerella stenobrocha 248]
MSSSTLQSSAFICRSCSRHLRPSPASLPPTRAFSTAIPRGQPSSTSPYSPYYVDIPFPPQRYVPWQPRAKGKRPVPRKVFKSANADRKVTAEYLAGLSKEPTNFSRPGEDAPAREKAYIGWKQKMADSRRRNVRDGLLELHAQSQKRNAIVAARSAEKQERRARLLAQEDPEVAQLTNPSILAALQTKHKLTDPDRMERLAASRARYIEHEETRIIARREHLHELYIRANTFIVATAQLEDVIERKFSEVASAESTNVMPPSGRDILTRHQSEDMINTTRDEAIAMRIRDALTGGNKRPKQVAADVGRPDVRTTEDLLNIVNQPMTKYGYPGLQGARGQMATQDLFQVLSGKEPGPK